MTQKVALALFNAPNQRLINPHLVFAAGRGENLFAADFLYTAHNTISTHRRSVITADGALFVPKR
jgi:hypothetical protein